MDQRISYSFSDCLAARALQEDTSNFMLLPGAKPLSSASAYVFVEEQITQMRDFGICQGAKVALLVNDSPEMALCFLAVASVGVACPLNPNDTVYSLHNIFRDLQPDCVVIDERLSPELFQWIADRGLPYAVLRPNTNGFLGRYDLDFYGQLSITVKEWMKPFALILPTSGSTGNCKFVPHTTEALLNGVRRTAECLNLNEADCGLLMVPMFHSHGLISGLLLPLVSGGSVIILGSFTEDTFLESLLKCRPTWYSVSPAIHREILSISEFHSREIFDSLRFVRSGSAPFDASTVQRIHERLGVPIIEAYGLTEVPHVSCNPVNAARVGSVGKRILPEIEIMDQEGHLLGPNQTGEIVLKGSNLFYDYLALKPNAPKYTNQWFQTGDIGYFDEEGYLFITGRRKEIINKGGVKLMPLEVDNILVTHPAVANALSFSVPHSTLGETLAAAVILNPKIKATESELISFVRKELGELKTPSGILFLKTFPKGPTGKYMRSEMLPIWNKHMLGEEYSAPSNAMEETVAEVFKEVLKIDVIGRNSHYIHLGGDSLKASRIAARLSSRVGRPVPLALILENPSVASLATALSQAELPEEDPAYRKKVEMDALESDALSYQESRLVFLDTMHPESLDYILPAAWDIHGSLDVAQAKLALETVIRRHVPLRSGYILSESGISIKTLDLDILEFCSTDLSLYSEEIVESKLSMLSQEFIERPFDLANDLKVRCQIFQLGKDLYHLLVVFHHIAVDALSLQLFQDEWMHAYLSIASISPEALSPSYRDYAQKQRAKSNSRAFQQSLEFWKSELSELPVLELPKNPILAPQNGNFVNVDFQIPADLANQLDQIARNSETTQNTLLLAAAHILLAKWTGQTDFAIGMPMTERPTEADEKLIGFYVNTIVLRNRLDPKQRFSGFLNQVRENAHSVYRHSEVPFDRIVSTLQPDRSSSTTPFFRVIFQLLEVGVVAPVKRAIQMQRKSIKTPSIRFDMEIYLKRSGDVIYGSFLGSHDCFDADSLERLSATYVEILKQIAGDSERQIDSLEYLLPADFKTLNCRDQERVALDKETNLQNVVKRFDMIAESYPNNIAIESIDRRITYENAQGIVRRISNQLLSSGVMPGDRVGVFLERSQYLPLSLIAILKIGAVYLPLDRSYSAEVLAYMLDDAAPKVILTDTSSAKEMNSSGGIVIDLNPSYPDLPKDWSLPEIMPNSPAYLMYSSGSTGRPKGILVPHSGVLRLVCDVDYCKLGAEEVFLQLASPSFDAATFEIWGALLNGGKLVMPSSDKPGLDEIRDLVHDFQVSILWLTSGLFHLVIDAMPELLEPLGQLLAGGDVLSPKHVERCRALYPELTLINGYGPTENTTFSCCYTINELRLNTRSVPIGYPISNSTVLVVDAEGRICPPGVRGEIILGGDGLAIGYWKDNDLTEAKFFEGEYFGIKSRYYRSGDYGRFLSDGRLLFDGRIDSQVKVRGYRVELDGIAKQIEAHPAILAAVTVDLEDEQMPGNKSLGAAIVFKSDPMIADLKVYLNQCLPTYMIPSHLLPLNKLPLNSNGKVDLHKIRKLLKESNAGPNRTKHSFDISERGRALLECWQTIFPGVKIDFETNFFSVGGDSLKAMRLIAIIKQQMGISLPLNYLFQYPDITSFYKYIDTVDRLRCRYIVPIATGDSHLKIVLMHGVKGEVFCYEELRHKLAQYSVFGVQSAIHTGRDDHDDFNKMCEDYATELLDEFKGKPIVLCGYSLGGKIAYETARRLKLKGADVAEVVIIDTYIKNLPFYINIMVFLTPGFREIMRNLSYFPKWPKIYYRRIKLKLIEFYKVFYPQDTAQLDEVGSSTTGPDRNWIKKDTIYRLARKYVPIPGPVNVTLFRSKNGVVHILPWRYLCRGRYRVISVECTHLDMVKASSLDLFLSHIKSLAVRNNPKDS